LIWIDWKIQLNKDVWLEAGEKEDIKLPYCIKLNWRYYIPAVDSRIQFDPLLLIRNYENWDLSNEIKLVILENDKEIVKEKVIEFVENISRLEDKKENYTSLIGKWVESIDISMVFTSEDESELWRLKWIYCDLIHIEEEYWIIN
jgi:hypothetical protein